MPSYVVADLLQNSETRSIPAAELVSFLTSSCGGGIIPEPLHMLKNHIHRSKSSGDKSTLAPFALLILIYQIEGSLTNTQPKPPDTEALILKKLFLPWCRHPIWTYFRNSNPKGVKRGTMCFHKAGQGRFFPEAWEGMEKVVQRCGTRSEGYCWPHLLHSFIWQGRTTRGCWDTTLFQKCKALLL